MMQIGKASEYVQAAQMCAHMAAQAGSIELRDEARLTAIICLRRARDCAQEERLQMNLSGVGGIDSPTKEPRS